MIALISLVAQVGLTSFAVSYIYKAHEDQTLGLTIDKHNVQQFLRVNVTTILMSWTCLYAIKIAFLLLYRRIFSVSARFFQAWWIVMAFVILSSAYMFAGSITICGSPSKLQDYGMLRLSFRESNNTSGLANL